MLNGKLTSRNDDLGSVRRFKWGLYPLETPILLEIGLVITTQIQINPKKKN